MTRKNAMTTRIGSLVKKLSHEIIRMKATFFVILVIPSFFLFVYYLGFGSFTTVGLTYSIGVVNEDSGVPDTAKPFLKAIHGEDVSETGFGENFTRTLAGLRYTTKDSSVKEKRVFNVIQYPDYKHGLDNLKERNIGVLVFIPENFSRAVLSLVNDYVKKSLNTTIPGFPQNQTAKIIILGDPSYVNYTVTSSIIQAAYQEYVNQLSQFSRISEISIDLSEVRLIPYTFYEFIAPGIIVFSAVINSAIMTGHLLRDREHRKLERLRLTPLRSYEYILGFLITYFMITAIQYFLLFILIKYVFVARYTGSYLLAYGLSLFLLLPNMGLSLVFSSIFQNSERTATFVALLAGPIGLMAGSFITIPKVVILKGVFPETLGRTNDLLLWDLLPYRHMNDLLRAILLYNVTFRDVWLSFTLFLGISLVWLGFGFILYSRTQLQRR